MNEINRLEIIQTAFLHFSAIFNIWNVTFQLSSICLLYVLWAYSLVKPLPDNPDTSDLGRCLAFKTTTVSVFVVD